jgi:HK97 family phage prohead protease
MNKDKTIKIEADGEFKFNFYIEKAVVGENDTEEKMTIKGVASTVNIDHDEERMSLESLQAMAVTINSESVPLRVEHQKEDNAVIGSVNKAWVDDRQQLWIEADLDKSHPGAAMLYKALKSGAKLGLSVGGVVKHAFKEFSESIGKLVKTFYDVKLQEVSVTSRPANFDAWLVQKSIKHKLQDGEVLVESPNYNGFLFENQDFDYMQSFAKSIPEDSWKKVNINNNIDKNMDKDKVKKAEETKEDKNKEKTAKEEEETKEKAAKEETDETKEKSVSVKEFSAFKSIIEKGFESLTALVAKMGVKKESTKEGEETTIMEDKKKAQAHEEGEKTDGETPLKEKAVDETEEDEKKEKAAKDETKEEAETKDYKIDAMKSIVKRIEALSKAMDETTEETKEKASSTKTEEDEKTEKSRGSELDQFVDSLTKAMDALEHRFTKSGKSVPGFREQFANMIKGDAEIQSVIKEMINQPGFKKSIQFGVPMMRTKDGKAYRLTAQNLEEDVEKSAKENKGKSFKDVYNKVASSSAMSAKEE